MTRGFPKKGDQIGLDFFLKKVIPILTPRPSNQPEKDHTYCGWSFSGNSFPAYQTSSKKNHTQKVCRRPSALRRPSSEGESSEARPPGAPAQLAVVEPEVPHQGEVLRHLRRQLLLEAEGSRVGYDSWEMEPAAPGKGPWKHAGMILN